MVYFEDIKLNKELMIKKTRMIDMGDHDVHFHELLEIGIILENGVRFRMENCDYYGHPGDVFICRPFEAHWGFPVDAKNSFEWILVLFSPSIVRHIPSGSQLLTPFYIKQTTCPIIPADSSYAQGIVKAALQAVKANEDETRIGEAKQFMHFIEILVHVYQYVWEQVQMDEIDDVAHDIVEAIGYLLEHVTQEIDLNTLIRRSNMGKTLFYRKFKQLTGLTPHDFINRLRIQIASQLLLTTTKSIIDIALESGYVSLSAFNKNFKLYFGSSPRDYRNGLYKTQDMN